ncbi:hypothetical protein D9M72_506850 [compost metagenome]
MVEAFACKRGIVAGLGEHEAALDDGLRVPGEAFGRPVTGNAAVAARGLDIGLECGGVTEDAAGASLNNFAVSPRKISPPRASAP